MQRASKQEGPDFLFNFSVGATCKWRYIDVQEITPCCVPPDFAAQGMGSVHEIKDPSSQGEDILKAGVAAGLFIVWPSLRQLCFMYDIEIPKPGNGAKGTLIKIDWAMALVEHLHPGAAAGDKTRMIDAIVCRTSKQVLTECEQKILDVLDQLDPENASSEVVHKVKALAKEVWKKKVRREVEETLESEAKRRRTDADDAGQPALLPLAHGGGPGNRIGGARADDAPAADAAPRRPYTKQDMLRALYPGNPPGPPYPRRGASSHHIKWEVSGPSLTPNTNAK